MPTVISIVGEDTREKQKLVNDILGKHICSVRDIIKFDTRTCQLNNKHIIVQIADENLENISSACLSANIVIVFSDTQYLKDINDSIYTSKSYRDIPVIIWFNYYDPNIIKAILANL